jgi:hypothetical protein
MRSLIAAVAMLAFAPARAQTLSVTGQVSDGVASSPFSVTATQQSSTPGNCNNQLGSAVIFCEPFDVANSGTPSRTGGLDPNVWGVSRTAGGAANLGQGQYNVWPPTTLIGCTATTTVVDPNDVSVCNSQLREALNDNVTGVFDAGTVAVLTMYPKQPFNFAGRTGTVSFDVSNDTQGGHSAWPEFWMTDLPVPAPFTFQGGWLSLPANGFAVRFEAEAMPGDAGLCPNSNNISVARWTVGSALAVRNYVLEENNLVDQANFGTASNPPLTVNILDCVIAPAYASGVMNHVEIRVTATEIDVYATDAGVAPSPTTLRKIASITNANLSLTQGLVWLEDAHYNADKETLAFPGSPDEKEHTFVWDNLAFDGPFPGRDFTYDALDALTPYTQDNVLPGTVNLGQASNANQTASWNVLNVPANPQGAAARVLFSFNPQGSTNPTVINVIVNGNAHSIPWPYPDQATNTWRTLAVEINLTDLVAGTNVVQIGSDQPMVSANVNIQLAGVPGAVPVLPGNSRVYP